MLAMSHRDKVLTCDVLLVGGGAAGTMLATILARNGFSVSLVEGGVHPRFTIGESTVPQMSMMLRIAALRFGVPELADIASFYRLRDRISTNCGVKRGFGFLVHQDGAATQGAGALQSPIPELLHGPESHWFRQDIDMYLMHVAIGSGVRVLQHDPIQTIDIDAERVSALTRSGVEIKSEYIVDASGPAGVVAKHLKLRHQQTTLQTHSRSMFCHLLGVGRIDDSIPNLPSAPRPWSQVTMHHMFDGGWFWVIPFNNIRSSNNPLVSVGLTLDAVRYPIPDDLSAGEEFDSFVAKFPSLSAHFKGAQAARPWVRTGRLQYNSSECVGARYCLMPHAAGFVDPLFSRGLANTARFLFSLGKRLIEAKADGRLGRERFAPLHRLQQGMLSGDDDLIATSYLAMKDPSLWNAWYRLWSIGTILDGFRLNRALSKFNDTHNRAYLDEIDHEQPFFGALGQGFDSYQTLKREAAARIRQADSGKLSIAQATQEIYELLGAFDGVPKLFAFADRTRQYTVDYELGTMLKLVRWGKTQSPPEIRALFDYSPKSFLVGFFKNRRNHQTLKPKSSR
ncbi:MAG TPA: FAD-dependent oxidoreductase [Nannocystis exedens]|nr:FAD-dependent oxidoreductase [Nannocystis exedens]